MSLPDAVIEEVVPARPRDLLGLAIRRALPFRHRRLVGPFCFLDEMGPADLAPGAGLDVPPHPHVGLATVTYLHHGALLHRDGLGTVQRIEPGDVNWMSAGRGIAHSERTPPDLRARGGRIHGLQLWVALPAAEEESAPTFAHHPAGTLPRIERDGASLVVVAGTAYGRAAPVRTLSPLFLVDATAPAGARVPLPDDAGDVPGDVSPGLERAVYVVRGRCRAGERAVAAGELAILAPGPGALAVESDARVALLGGAPLPEPRLIWWNFVASDPARIERARRDWAAGRFAPVPDEVERLPLPG